MNKLLRNLQGALVWLAPLVVVLAVVGVAYVALIDPRIARSRAARLNAEALEVRLAELRRSLDGSAPIGAGDALEALKEFERRAPAEDRLAKLTEDIARLALGSGPDVRELFIEAGATVTPQPSQSGTPRVVGGSGGGPDPRLDLFPVSLEYTPINVSFQTAFDQLGRFLWGLRNLPTIIEIRSLEMTRDVPYLKVKLELFAYRRLGSAVPKGPSAVRPPQAASDEMRSGEGRPSASTGNPL